MRGNIITRRTKSALLSGAAGLALVASGIAAPALAQGVQGEVQQTYEFDIPAMAMDAALNRFGVVADRQVMYSKEIVAGKIANPVSGAMAPRAALETMLDGSGLVYDVTAQNVFLVRTRQEAAFRYGEGRVQFASLQDKDQSDEGVATIDEPEGESEEEQESDTIVVTGTLIRGIAPDSSPTRTYSREDIQISGAGTAQDFIQTLPANFGGGSNAGLPSGAPGDNNALFNSGASGGLGSSVNLRGLGSASTLVLLNGHRLAPASGIGDFVDISMIPASAIERVEVLNDGASSIYGGDAVAGVVNFVLRDDFEGLETSFRYGVATQRHSAEEFRVGVTGGTSWDSGNALLAFEYFNQDQLGIQDRAFSQGTARLPASILPAQERYNLLVSLSQDLSSNLEVFTDVSFSRREATSDSTTSSTIFTRTPVTKNLNIAAGGTWSASETWTVDIAGLYSEVETTPREFNDFVLAFEREIDSKLVSGDVLVSGTVMPLPGGDLKLALGGHFRAEDFSNIPITGATTERVSDRDVFAVFGEAFIPIVGAGNAVPGIERLEINVSGRFDDFSDFGSSANPKVGVLWSPVEGLRLRGSYSTSFNPPPLGRINVPDLLASAFDFQSLLPVLGIEPADPLIANAIFLNVGGTAKDLEPETSRAFTAGLDFDRQWGRHSAAFSATWFDIDYEGRLGRTPIPGSQSLFLAPNIAFTNPSAFPEGVIVFSPSMQQLNDVLNSLDRVIENIPPFFGSAANTTIISNINILRNLSTTQVSGWDFDLSYTYETDGGDLVFGFDGTYLSEFKNQATVTTPSVDVVSTLFQPVDLRLRGRAGYAHNGFATNVFINYTNDYRADSTPDAVSIDSWTTVDLSLAYDTQDRMGSSVLNNTVFRLSVLNLFDQDPPAVPFDRINSISGYDATNSSPLGRFIAFEVTKRF